MVCAHCGADNPAGIKFCGQCGLTLTRRCDNCGFANPPGFQFCGNCGAALAGQPAAAASVPASSAASAPPDAERRQMTVMFCDLVGSTPLSERLDPEDLREVIRAYQEVCEHMISRYEGYMAAYLGDGLLIYFGYPLAHENDAHRAVRAALGIVEAVDRLNARLQTERAIKLGVRLGIHTGVMVVGEMGAGERRDASSIVGEHANIAARVQAAAEPDTVVISAATYHLIEGFFECRSLGAQTLKGISRPLELYQVLHESTARSRLEVEAIAGLTPLVGRKQELALLLEGWERVKAGAGQVVLLSGEAGIGKSRLVEAVKEQVAAHPRAWLTPCQCSPFYQNSSLYPIIDLLQRIVLQFDQGETAEQKMIKLEGFLVQYGMPLADMVPLFAGLLSVPLNERYAPLNLAAEQQKQKLLEALLRVLLDVAHQQPLLFVVEDLHWMDPTTLELLGLLVDQGPTTRILALFTYRPDFTPPWTGRSHVLQLTLTRLTRQQVEGMIHEVTRGKTLPAEVLEQIVNKTDGVPLFVEELTKTVLESTLLKERPDRYDLTGPLPPLAIPSTLRDSLMARLDRLATVKEVAQLGATLGREFSYQLLRAVAPMDEGTLQHEIGRLVGAELLYQRGVPPQSSYIFKHALVQEAAYESQLKRRRQQVHERIADTLVERFPEMAGTQPEVVAHHYTEAGLPSPAIEYWQRAGRRAVERSASLEGIAHFTKGLNLLARIPSDKRRERELALRTGLGPALMSTKGLGSREAEANYTRALELCRELGERPEFFAVLRGLWEFHELRGDLKTALTLGEELLRLAAAADDTALRLIAHDVLGDTLYWRGDFPRALEHLEEGITLYRIDEHRALAHQHAGYDPGVACRSFSAYTLWYLGYPERAIRRIEEAVALARELSQTFSTSLALLFSATIHHLRGEVLLTKADAETVVALSTEQANVFMLGCAMVEQGWAIAHEGRADEGAAYIERGMDECRTSGAVLEFPHPWTCLAEAYRCAGRISEALQAVTEGLKQTEETSASFKEAELHRLKGELLLVSAASGEDEHAERCFREAIEIARRQSAKSVELRAATSLGRLLQQQGKREDARRLLVEVYAWFTEGFDTADLKKARALLDELAIGAERL